MHHITSSGVDSEAIFPINASGLSTADIYSVDLVDERLGQDVNNLVGELELVFDLLHPFTEGVDDDEAEDADDKGESGEKGVHGKSSNAVWASMIRRSLR